MKIQKLLSAVTAFAFTLTAVPSGMLPAEASSIIYGDVNGDGKINIYDLILLKKEVNAPNTTTIIQKNADVNQDNILNIYDIQELQNFLSCRTEVFSANVKADNEEISLPAISSETYQLSEGNSKPFSFSPLDGLTVSAEKNALDYDGQLKFSEISAKEEKTLDNTLKESGILMIESWHVDANLNADDYLPKSFHSDYDLRTLDMPQELYEDVIVIRIDDNGNIQQYATELNDSHISWDSTQNSFLVLGLLTTTGLAVAGKVFTIEALYYIACLTAGVTIVDWTAMYDKEHAMNSEQLKQLCCYETDEAVIWYSSYDENTILREKRIREAENQAYQEAEKMVQDSGFEDEYAGKLNCYRKLEEKTAEFQKRILADNAQYQKDITAREELPADVVLLAKQLKIANTYLTEEQKTGKLGYKPDIIFTPSAKDLGNEQKPKALFRNSFMIVKRDPSLMKDSQMCKKSASVNDLYGNIINKPIADDMLITVTHEMFHMHQHKKYNGTDKAHLDFSEFSANILEMQCAEYYKNEKLITTPYTNENIGGYETYAVPIDRNDAYSGSYSSDENVMKAHGYTLAEFYQHITEKTGKSPTAWQVVDAYKKNQYSITKSMMKCFGIASHKDFTNYWKSYTKSVSSKLADRSVYVARQKQDGDAYFPSLLRSLHLSKTHQKEIVEVTPADFTAKLGYIYCADSPEYTVLMIRNKNFSSSLPTFGFGMGSPSGKKQTGQNITDGIALYMHDWEGAFYERQGSGNSGHAKYTAYLLAPPKTPVLVYDEALQAFHLNLQEDRSQAGADGITDCFRVIWKNNQKEVYSQMIEFDKWTDDIIVTPEDLNISLTEKFTLSVTVQEYGLSKGEYQAFTGAESEPAVLKFGSDIAKTDTDFPYFTKYQIGDVSTSWFSDSEQRPHFILKEDGTFILTIPDYFEEKNVHSPAFLQPDEIYCYDSEKKLNGCTLTGKLIDMKSTQEWSAEIESCSVNSFSSYYQYVPFDDDGNSLTDLTTNKSWTGSNSGKIKGTVACSGKPYYESLGNNIFIVTIKAVLDIPLTCTDGSTMESESVVFEGSYVFHQE